MPFRPPHPCGFSGCPNLTRDGQYCAEHAAQMARAYDRARGSASSRGYDSRWRGVRARHLAAFPLCADPYRDHQIDGVVVAASEVHHIKPLRDGGTNADENLLSLCKACHSKITAETAFGTGRAGQIATGHSQETGRGVLKSLPQVVRSGVER